jgi:hypothetical protein
VETENERPFTIGQIWIDSAFASRASRWRFCVYAYSARSQNARSWPICCCVGCVILSPAKAIDTHVCVISRICQTEIDKGLVSPGGQDQLVVDFAGGSVVWVVRFPGSLRMPASIQHVAPDRWAIPKSRTGGTCCQGRKPDKSALRRAISDCHDGEGTKKYCLETLHDILSCPICAHGPKHRIDRQIEGIPYHMILSIHDKRQPTTRAYPPPASPNPLGDM